MMFLTFLCHIYFSNVCPTLFEDTLSDDNCPLVESGGGLVDPEVDGVTYQTHHQGGQSTLVQAIHQRVLLTTLSTLA